MPNVRHEELLDGLSLPEIIRPEHPLSKDDQSFEDNAKSDGHVCKSQYREDLKNQVR